MEKMAPISKQQIEKAEQLVQANIASNPKFSELLRTGKVKFVVEPGEKLSQIVIVNMDDPKMIQKYGGRQMFNTPQEAEHFTAGYGNEPTRSVGGKLAGSVVAPLTQHSVTDPVRAEQRERSADIAQDVLSSSRYVLPIASQFASRTPVGAALSTLAAATGIGAANKGLSHVRDDEPYEETLPQIGLTAAAAATGAAANKALSEDYMKNKQLAKQISKNLQIRPGTEGWDANIVERVREPLEAKAKELPQYTFGDWRKQPLRDFDAATGAQDMNISFKRLPVVHAGETTSKVMKRAPGQKISDEIASRFINELGIDRNDVNIDEVKKFLENAWLRPKSDEGIAFYGTQKTPKMTKQQWTKKRANETNQFTKDLYGSQVTFDDPDMQRRWDAAKQEYAERYAKIKGKANTPIVTPAQYENMGKIKVLGKNIRPGLRGAATVLLPMATQAVGKYILNKLPSGDNNGQ